jgi:transposase
MNAREIKAAIIVTSEGVTWANGTYHVRSQSKPGAYSVRLDGLFPTCSCDDFDLTHCECKHIIAARMWRDQKNAQAQPNAEPLPPVAPPEMPKRKTYKQDWPNYNLAQNRERDHFQDLLRDLCASIPEPEPKGGKKGGRPTVPARDAAFLSIFKVYSGFSARRFVCDVQSAHERGCIAKPVCHNSVLKAMESESLTPILHDLIRRSAAPLAAVETDFAVDSTGFATNTYTRWFDVKWGQKELQHWVKPHIVTGVRTNCIAACEIHDKNTADCNVLPSLTVTTAQTFTIHEMSADKAYTATNNFNAVAAVGGTLYAAFKNNTTGSVGGLYEKMWHLFCANKEDYLAHYHKRSNVESTFSAVKRKFGEMVLSKTDTAQKNEVLCKFACQNVCCLIHAMYELGITPPGWNAQPEDSPAVLRFPGVA